jgi:ABC-2 type transport system permease protein
MSKILVIAWREFKAIVLTKSYLASILLVPLVVFGTIVIAFSLQFINIASKPVLPAAILDQSGELSQFILHKNGGKDLNLQIYNTSNASLKACQELSKLKVICFTQPEFSLTKLQSQIKLGKLEGLLTIPSHFFESRKVTYLSRNNLMGALPPELNQMLERYRFYKLKQKTNLQSTDLDLILKPISVQTISLIENKKGRNSSSLRLLAAAAIYGILSVCIAIHGSKLTMSILEEKKTKIVEILLSSVKPIEFMWGKILGSGAAAILQTGIWSAMLFIGFVRSGAMVFETTARVIIKSGQAGAALDPLAGTQVVGAAVQETANLSALSNPQIALNPAMLTYLVLFTITGFLLYATLFAAVGALANSVTEAQYLETPLVFLMMFPTYLFLPLIENPNGPVIVASSFFPYFSPFVMYSRICVDQVPFWHIMLSLLFVVLAIGINVYLVSGLYRAGLLLYGKKVTFKELGGLLKNIKK